LLLEWIKAQHQIWSLRKLLQLLQVILMVVLVEEEVEQCNEEEECKEEVELVVEAVAANKPRHCMILRLKMEMN